MTTERDPDAATERAALCIVEELLALPDDERGAAITARCGEDVALRGRVEALLRNGGDDLELAGGAD